jgi:hypothetical protein
MERPELWELPPDLMAMGWHWVPAESAEHRTSGPTWYTVVYARPFEQVIDDDTLAYQNKGGLVGPGVNQPHPECQLGRGVPAGTRAYAGGRRQTVEARAGALAASKRLRFCDNKSWPQKQLNRDHVVAGADVQIQDCA